MEENDFDIFERNEISEEWIQMFRECDDFCEVQKSNSKNSQETEERHESPILSGDFLSLSPSPFLSIDSDSNNMNTSITSSILLPPMSDTHADSMRVLLPGEVISFCKYHASKS